MVEEHLSLEISQWINSKELVISDELGQKFDKRAEIGRGIASNILTVSLGKWTLLSKHKVACLFNELCLHEELKTDSRRWGAWIIILR